METRRGNFGSIDCAQGNRERLRTDDRHFSTQNIDELRSFVEAGAAQNLAYPRDVMIPVGGRIRYLFPGNGGRAPKLEGFKRRIVEIVIPEPTEDRSRRLELDRQRDEGNERDRSMRPAVAPAISNPLLTDS